MKTEFVNIGLLIKLTILFASSLTIMAGATISPALPQMANYFSDVPNSNDLAKLILTFPALTVGLGSFFSGYLIDKLGRRPVLIVGIFFYGIFGTAGFFLDSIYAILVTRGLLGLSVSAIMTGCTTLIADYFSGKELNKFMGLQAGFIGFGGVVFLLVGGILADFGWRYPFLFYILAFFILIPVILIIKETKNPLTQLGSQLGEKNEYSKWSLLPIYLIAFLCMVVFYTIPVHLPFYLKELEPNTLNSEVGLALAVLVLFSATVSISYQWFKSRFHYIAIFVQLFFLLGLGYLIISQASNYLEVFLGCIVCGIGLGTFLPNLNVWLVSLVPISFRGRALGGLSTGIFLGQFFSPILTNDLVKNYGANTLYLAIFYGLLVVAILFFLWNLAVQKQNSKVEKSESL